MASSVNITTPMPSVEQVARRLGISASRRRFIVELADQAVSDYAAKTSRSSGPWTHSTSVNGSAAKKNGKKSEKRTVRKNGSG